MSSGGCPFAGVGISLFAALAGLGTILMNTKRFMRQPLEVRLPAGVDRDEEGKLWFREISEFWKGQCFSIRIEKIVYSGKSQLQEILIFDSEKYGRVLVLDGAIQVTTLDEVAYQEVMAHTPMHLINNGECKRALVIGGGDGGVLRELAKYPEIQEIYICEIDGDVIELSKKYLSTTSIGYSDPRVKVFVEDGFKFLQSMINEGILFDVVVSDLSDPIGPAESIFNGEFLELLAKVVEPKNGVAALQGECYWLHSHLIRQLVDKSKSLFKNVSYATIAIPTYPCGQIGCLVMSSNPVTVPRRNGGVNPGDLRYYSRELHSAQFVLPKLVEKFVYGD
jgi:spermidine synthase